MKSFYDILGVSKFASGVEIKKAYILRSKMMHPDRFNQTSQKEEWDMANEMLKELNHAYGVLKDPVSRSTYDRTIGGDYSQHSAPPPQSSTYSSPPPRREAEPPPMPKKPQHKAPPTAKGVDMPEPLYKGLTYIACFIVVVAIVAAFNKKSPTIPPLDLSVKASNSTTPKYKPSSYSRPSTTPRAVQTVPSDYPEPSNEYVFKNRFESAGDGKLKITNGCSSHSVVKLVDIASDKAVYAGFVRANSVLNITRIPDGTYRLLFAAGHGWDDIDGRFKQSEGSSEFREPLVFTTTPITRDGHSGIQFKTMSITLNTVVGGTAKADSISTGDFEKY